MNNNLYNLMLQCVQEQKSLWRIKDDYIKDSENNSLSKAFWKKMLKDKEEHIEELINLIKKEI